MNSSPPGADVALDELEPSCQTPCELDVKPARYELHIKKAGYHAETVQLVKRMSAWFWINFLEGPGVIIGMGIDALTGSIFRLSPHEVSVKLVPLNGDKAPKVVEPKKDESTAEDDTEVEADAESGPPSDSAPIGNDRVKAPAAAVEEPPPLPPTEEVKRLKEVVPEETLDREVTLYYGSIGGARRDLVKRRLYNILLQQLRDGETPDIDEAVKIEHFRYR